jgi:hypothetical protein
MSWAASTAFTPVVKPALDDLKQAFTAQGHVLRALRDTQLEQVRALAEHGQVLGAIVVTLQSMQEAQQSMQETLTDDVGILVRLDPGD